ncbi:MAG: hypothetical protein IJV83_03795 [Clostridia bacterium]|nr:hypothetical protein [Clostridia bacterium]
MQFLEWMHGWTNGQGEMAIAAAIAFTILLIFTVFSCVFKNTALYVAGAFLAVGGIVYCLEYFLEEQKMRALYLAIAFGVDGVLGICVAAVLAIRTARERKRKRLYISAKKTACGLPPQGNEYVRSRLNTVLRKPEDEVGFSRVRESALYENRESVRLGYARRLIVQIKDAPLTQAEYLETQTLSQILTEYGMQGKWSAEELRKMNDVFSRLLKLAAKYSVETTFERAAEKG